MKRPGKKVQVQDQSSLRRGEEIDRTLLAPDLDGDGRDVPVGDREGCWGDPRPGQGARRVREFLLRVPLLTTLMQP